MSAFKGLAMSLFTTRCLPAFRNWPGAKIVARHLFGHLFFSIPTILHDPQRAPDIFVDSLFYFLWGEFSARLEKSWTKSENFFSFGCGYLRPISKAAGPLSSFETQ